MRRSWYLLIALSVVLVDALTKWIVSSTIDLHSSIPVIPRLFDIVHVRNRGAAFGIGANADSELVPLLLNGGAIVVFIVVVVYSLRTSVYDLMPQAGLHLILGGAIGNLIDRFRLGYVVDFLDFHAGDHHWPAFNIADAAIVTGICLLFLDMKRKQEEPRAADADPRGKADDGADGEVGRRAGTRARERVGHGAPRVAQAFKPAPGDGLESLPCTTGPSRSRRLGAAERRQTIAHGAAVGRVMEK